MNTSAETTGTDFFDFSQVPEKIWGPELQHFLMSALHAACWVLVGLLLLKIISKALTPLLHKHLSPQAAHLLLLIIKRGGQILVFIEAFALMGFDVVTLLGAAGIIGVAVGFASQTSLSNIISGLFLVGERQINLGDIVEINGIRGTVDSINLLSLQLRLPDNTMVRVPNELILKNPVSNVTRFETRRCDISFSVDYSSDLAQVVDVLKEVLTAHPLCLSDPKPNILFSGFQDSGISFTVGAWCRRDDYMELRLSLAQQIKSGLEKAHISMPFPIVSLDVRGNAIPIDIMHQSASTAPAESTSKESA
jgi:small-conductance mechanosensitive channel